MIIKLIAAKSNPKRAQRYARDLARYFAEGDRRWLGPDAAGIDYGLTLSAYMTGSPRQAEPPPERVLNRGALVRGEVRGWDEGLAEIERRLQRRSRKVKKPVRHVILSCPAGERLSERSCADAVATLAAELGCEQAAIQWAAHGDTDHFHLHMMFVTVDPATGAALPFGQEPDGRAGYKEAMQRAIARIEHAEQLQAEAGARYQVIGDELVRKPASELSAKPAARRRAPLRQEILDWEERSGFASFTRVAQEIAGPLLDDASSWRQLHEALASHGIGVRPAVNGGELHAGDEHVKLSNIDRRHSWSQLTKPDRLGPYEEPTGEPLGTYQPHVIDPDKARRWLARSDQLREVAERVDQRVATLLAVRDAAFEDASDQLSAYQADIAGFNGDPRLKRHLSAAWPQLRASAQAAIRSAFAGRIEAVRALRYAAAGSDELDRVDLDALGAPDFRIGSWLADPGSPPVMALNGFEAERRGDIVRYWSDADQHRNGQPALVDAGAIIWVNDRSGHAVEAALTLAHARFGAVAVFGDAAYLRQCEHVAKRLGIKLETITVAEARRRVRTDPGGRDAARRRAVNILTDRAASVVRRRRAWARAYNRAASVDDAVSVDASPPKAHVPHHREIPIQNATMVIEHETSVAPIQSVTSVPVSRHRPVPGPSVDR